MSERPEQQARRNIDSALAAVDWRVQYTKHVNITTGRGVAIREFPSKSGHGFADYLLYLDGAAAGVVYPDVLAGEIIDDRQAALDEFALIAADMRVK